MDQTVQTVDVGYAGAVGSVEQRNRVLRNTYWLLALSMVPTVLGAWVGITTGAMATLGVGMSTIVFLGGAFAFMFAIEKTKNSAAGVPVLLGFSNGAGLIMTAFAGTGLVFLGMAFLSTVIKRDLSVMGKFLFIGAVMVLVAMIANIFLQSSALMITLSVLVVGIFSAFIVYDLQRVKNGMETNYITATLGVYISLYNVFSALLSILGFAGGNRN